MTKKYTQPPVFRSFIVKKFAEETAQKFVQKAREKYTGFDNERTEEIVAIGLTIGKVDFDIAEILSPGLFTSKDNMQNELREIRNSIKKCYQSRTDLHGTLPFRLFILRFLNESPTRWEKQAYEVEEKTQVEYPHEKLPSVNLAEKMELLPEYGEEIVKEAEDLVDLVDLVALTQQFHSLSNDDQEKFISYINSYSALSR